LYLYDKPLQWVCSVKYLGVTLMSAKKISFDLNQVRRKFFGCVNSILNHSAGMSVIVWYGKTAFSRKLLLSIHCYHMHLNVLTSQVHICNNWVPVGTRFTVKYSTINHGPLTSVREIIYCLGRMNFEYLFYKKKLCFLHSLRGCKNVVVSSVMEVFVRSEEYRKAYDFANVKPCDNKDKIAYCSWE